MKTEFLFFLTATVMTCGNAADDRIYRCGNEYTNTVSETQARNCKLISGGNVTVVQAPRPVTGTRVASSAQRVESADQRSRDSDARLILEAELKKAQSRQGELLKEYNNGEPEKFGPESRNNQKYIDRIAELRSSISRNENDIAGIQRELARASAASASASNKQ